MKLKKDNLFGFFYCPECGLPLKYIKSKDVYICDSSYPVVSLKGCGFIIIASDVDEI